LLGQGLRADAPRPYPGRGAGADGVRLGHRTALPRLVRGGDRVVCGRVLYAGGHAGASRRRGAGRACSRRRGARDAVEYGSVAGVFISYRRDDTRPWAIALRDQLAQAFGERRVFFDVDSMNAGNWRAQIDQALERSAVVLVVIGPRWTTAADAEGHQRLLLPDDVHRMEVASAL